MRSIAIILAGCAALTAVGVFAGTPTTQPAPSRTQDRVFLGGDPVGGKWSGEKGGIQADLIFGDGDTVTWRQWHPNPNTMIVAQLSMLQEPAKHIINLRADYYDTVTGEHHSEIVGRLEQGPHDALLLSFLDAAAKMDKDYVAVNQIALARARE